MKQTYLFLIVPIFVCLLSHCNVLFSQTTFLNGVINEYYSVQAMGNTPSSIFLYTPAASFATNDEVLIIQMKGGSIHNSNDPNFGTITNLGATGLMERATVCRSSANELFFQHNLVNTFDDPSTSNSIIQVVKFSRYNDVQITGTLTAPVWDGSTGGVLVLSATGTVNMQADINLSGLGFQGGAKETIASGCSNFPWPIFDAYYYAQSDNGGAMKGEGVIPFEIGKEYGRGAQATGGGGANEHNAGGAGGGNFGSGGQGGEKTTGGSVICVGMQPGIGGVDLQTDIASSDRLFMGGGGGAGNDNDGESGEAGNGGGIVIIMADEIQGNGFSISARGESAQHSNEDGGSGGGAGGSILLSTNTFGNNALNLDVSGGTGGNAGIAANCLGPGGGGGGGFIRTASPLTANVSYLVQAGLSGIIDIGVSLACAGSNSNAAAGTDGSLITGAQVPAGTITGSCVLSHLEQDRNVDLVPSTNVKIKLYPNPISLSENIHLKIESPQTGWMDLSLFDKQGKLLFEKSKEVKEGTSHERIPTSQLSPGMYYLRVLLQAKLYCYPIILHDF